MPDPGANPRLERVLVAAAGAAGIGAIGAFDYVSGAELRVYPFYWGPVALLAWHFGRPGALAGAVLAAGSWSYFNFLAGLSFSSDALWVANVAVQGGSFLLVGILISTLHHALTSARALGRTDPLTGLRNTRAFYEDAVPLLALCRRNGQPITIAYVDLDHFKAVNDRFGHQAGDALLRGVAEAIRAGGRPSDLAARIGGDEFAIMLPGLADAEARVVLERVRAGINQAAERLVAGVTASVGAVMTVDATPEELTALVQRADALMYEAKTGGRDRLRLERVGARGTLPKG